MDRDPTVWFERYADDAVLHCVSERQAVKVLSALEDRMAEVGLRLHPDKTRIVYCKDGKRRGSFRVAAFTFLGFTFRARCSQDRNGKQFLSFDPGISKDALKKISSEVRSWHLHTRSDLSFTDLARRIKSCGGGVEQLLRPFQAERIDPLSECINAYLVRWIRQKCERLAPLRKALAKLREIAQRYPRMFTHWRCTTVAASGW
ncbi:reverse transcriptase domain-containing protein [Streptomyces sp. NPDC086010]|uniref:reverse transcriptase domain-containing protein n=1 Tax=Streptomyces sp. NPDC086010 TaxID=3365745 RepID=UPI0037CF536D